MKKILIILIVLVLLGVITFGILRFYFIKSFKASQNNLPIVGTNLKDNKIIWKSYNNKQFIFEAKFPSAWNTNVVDYAPPGRSFLSITSKSPSFRGELMSDIIREPKTGKEGMFIIKEGQIISTLVYFTPSANVYLDDYLQGYKNSTTKEIIVDGQKAIYNERILGSQIKIETYIISQRKERVTFGISLEGLVSEADYNRKIFNTFLSNLKFN